MSNYKIIFSSAILMIRFTSSQADLVVLKAVGATIDAAKYVNASRWFAHISSFSLEEQAL